MKVAIVFDRAFDGDSPGAIWLLDSPANRAWFARHCGSFHPNSALFDAASAAMNIIWSAQEHHPSWREVQVIGLPLTPEIAASCAKEGSLEPIPDGFRLLRP
jgi:hypothetical protein